MTNQAVFLEDAERVYACLEFAHTRVCVFNGTLGGPPIFPVTMWVANTGSLISVDADTNPFDRYASAIVWNHHPCDGDVVFSCHWGINSDGTAELGMTSLGKDYPEYGRGYAERYVPAHQVEMMAPLLSTLVDELVIVAANRSFARHPQREKHLRRILAEASISEDQRRSRARFIFEGEDYETVWREVPLYEEETAALEGTPVP